ncbi:MAG: PAS domain-containing sensor histidine kinase [Ruminococcaceae bacterium]|nr:PAS domain-containing sensor histidine kinase [Oscillospiraceae bacterium]
MNKHLKNAVVTVGILTLTYGFGFLLKDVFEIWEHITTAYVFSVFLISLLTDGYVWGIFAGFSAVLFINYAFTYPYFDVDFSASESIFSAAVMVIISVLTSAITTQLKHWKTVKAEGEMERMRANLLRAVSHDLRTPLTTIYGASSSILDNYERLSDIQKMQMIGGIREDADWLIRMVENLLSITRIDSGNVKLIKTPTVLEELIDAVILKFRKRYPAQHISLSLPDSLVVIPMDAMLIEQVIINMLENAIHHAGDFTTLTLRVRTEQENAIFEIEDDGCGIPRERLEHLFTGYYDINTEKADTQKRNAGIGLSVCATIIKAHGGTISAENRSGGGAVFRFALRTDEVEGHEQQQ